MDYNVRKTDSTTEVLLSGRLTFTDHEQFRSVMALFDEPVKGQKFVFDLSGLEFVDSSGLGMFLIARDTAERNDCQLVLRGAHNQVRRILDIAKFGTIFNIED